MFLDSIVVIDQGDGFVYAEGIDYEVDQLGGVLAEIRILPNGRITEDIDLWISYRFELQPSVEYEQNGSGYHVSFSTPWFRVFHNLNRNEHELLEGLWEVLPPDEENITSGLDADWANDDWRLGLRASMTQRIVGEFESETVMANQFLTYRHSSRMSLRFSASQSNSTASGVIARPGFGGAADENEIITDLISFDASIFWTPRANLSIEPRVGLWRREQEFMDSSQDPTSETYLSASLILKWQVRQLSVDLRYYHNAIDNLDSRRDEDRIMARLIRVF